MAKVSCVSIKHNMIDDNPSPKLQVLLTASIKLVTQMIPQHETVRFFLLFFSSNGREKKNPQNHRQPSPAPVCSASLQLLSWGTISINDQ